MKTLSPLHEALRRAHECPRWRIAWVCRHRRQSSIRLVRLAETLRAIDWLQAVGSLERQHPPWILRGKSADLIQQPKLVLGEREFGRREIVLKLVEAFRTNDDRGYHRLCQEPRERKTRGTAPVYSRDRSHQVEDIPGPPFVHDGKVVLSAARIRGFLVRPAELAGKQAAGKRTPHQQADLFGFQRDSIMPSRREK